MSIVKEYDGQVKTPEDRNRERDDDAHNEVDGEEAIKLYDELVKSLEDRLVLEKEIPSLIGRARQSDHGRKTETTPERKGRPNAKCLPKSEGRRRAIDASSKAPVERSGDFNPSMLLTGALPVTPRLIRVHLAHTLEKIFGIGLRNIWRPRPFAAALFRLPWNWSWWFWFLPPFGHTGC